MNTVIDILLEGFKIFSAFLTLTVIYQWGSRKPSKKSSQVRYHKETFVDKIKFFGIMMLFLLVLGLFLHSFDFKYFLVLISDEKNNVSLFVRICLMALIMGIGWLIYVIIDDLKSGIIIESDRAFLKGESINRMVKCAQIRYDNKLEVVELPKIALNLLYTTREISKNYPSTKLYYFFDKDNKACAIDENSNNIKIPGYECYIFSYSLGSVENISEEQLELLENALKNESCEKYSNDGINESDDEYKKVILSTHNDEIVLHKKTVSIHGLSDEQKQYIRNNHNQHNNSLTDDLSSIKIKNLSDSDIETLDSKTITEIKLFPCKNKKYYKVFIRFSIPEKHTITFYSDELEILNK
jgi:hypothetical protein